MGRFKARRSFKAETTDEVIDRIMSSNLKAGWECTQDQVVKCARWLRPLRKIIFKPADGRRRRNPPTRGAGVNIWPNLLKGGSNIHLMTIGFLLLSSQVKMDVLCILMAKTRDADINLSGLANIYDSPRHFLIGHV